MPPLFRAFPALALAAILGGCTHLRVDPEGALDHVEGDLLVLIDGLEVSGPPTFMVNAKKAAAAFDEAATEERVCAQLVSSLQGGSTFGDIACQALAGAPAAFAPMPGLQFRLGTFDMPLPKPGDKLLRKGAAPPWVLILDQLSVSYERRGGGSQSYPVLVAQARVAWWSNAETRTVAWGQDRAEVRTAGWLAPQDVGTAVSEALDLLAWRILRHAGWEVG